MHGRSTERLWLFPALRSRREDGKLTQSGLAQFTKKHDPEGGGVSKETISKLERGHGASRRLAMILIDTLSEVCGEQLKADAELTQKGPSRRRGTG